MLPCPARCVGHVGCYQGASDWLMTDVGESEGRVEQANTTGPTISFEPPRVATRGYESLKRSLTGLMGL
jgi:hypothetical protein